MGGGVNLGGILNAPLFLASREQHALNKQKAGEQQQQQRREEEEEEERERQLREAQHTTCSFLTRKTQL